MSPAAAIRLVGWEKYDAGYVDNIHGTRTFPTSGVTWTMPRWSRQELQLGEDRRRARAASSKSRRLVGHAADHGPAPEGQQRAGYEAEHRRPAPSPLFPRDSDDRWTQAALTVEGKIGNFDLTYAYSHLRRRRFAGRLQRLLLVRQAHHLRQLFPRRRQGPIPPAQHQRQDGYTRPATNCA